MEQSTFDFYDDTEDRDTFFIPTNERTDEVIVKIDDARYYLWRDGEPLMELIPIPLIPDY